MCILHRQLEIFFPIRTLFGQGRVAKTRFDPMRVALRVNACYLHIIELLVARDRFAAERAIRDRLS